MDLTEARPPRPTLCRATILQAVVAATAGWVIALLSLIVVRILVVLVVRALLVVATAAANDAAGRPMLIGLL